MKKLLKILVMVVVALAATAQRVAAEDLVESYKFDFGAGLGMSGYLGDANTSNLFAHPGFAANLGIRYLFNSRFAAKAQLEMAQLSGNTADYDNVLPDAAQFSFKSTAYSLLIKGEANFFAYGIGETYKRLRRWTPFVSVGLGASVGSAGGKMTGAFAIPLGVGVKFKINQRLNFNAEFTMTKTFTDRLDSPDLSDPYQIESSFLKNTDWYSTLTVGISYEFGARCVTCHRID